MATIEDFEKLDIRVGKILVVEDFPEARYPAYKLTIDFGGDIGIKKSSGQFTQVHSKEELLDSLVLCVVNFPPRQVGKFLSEVLTLGVPDANGDWIAITPSQPTKAILGGRLA